MTASQPQSGYTLPVFACAAAIAALRWLRQPQPLNAVSVDLIAPPETVSIPIEQVAGLREGIALAITRSDPGDNLDLTRNTPIWALVEWGQPNQCEQVRILGGEGIGRQMNAGGKAAIYSYAQRLLQDNLSRLLAAAEKIQVTFILPAGRQLAERTSNAAFGVVEGLSLLGTTGISQPLSSPEQLEAYRQELQEKASRFNCLVFCVGENGLDLARNLGINPEQLVKTANWLGPLFVTAGLQHVPAILLFGYHGKLIKLAGGIFHTHHHLADGRLEILTAHCAQVGLPTSVLQVIFTSPTTEVALQYLRQLDIAEGSNWVEQVYGAIAFAIDQRSQDYIRKHSEQSVQVGSVLFDRDRQIVTTSQIGATLLGQLC
ncbi:MULTISPECIES: cobalt-precorrin-5B (C(1))-methyltransferase CbiD [unclassified Coleofasciculus]|uniref:cobalt-precorrin-5B (C(1))-methyltransferase CbiD n=1 Tax=unclassified Coleofasciculus TaxID=2692782 RepID=UPI001881105A|nr:MULTISPECIES: cobalt-precorrin-5B (C(1))-methyltransferase CbiD [unclassified Coleofasciculus]MBE9125708.1 cobalt-precorrin-5B (C(1))-methyltransferase [Coleofasciculus sp. LEGE 07081]MBE9148318.1 cobalt-precorrin-5B (C(1))-methyltransferase [Coleofasciculus sp. LEGE 07092]